MILPLPKMTPLEMEGPINVVSRVQPPAAGISPFATSGSANQAFRDATRRSQASVSSKPPAIAAP